MMKRRAPVFFSIFLLALMLFPVTAKADMGPKPSVTVRFQGLEEETYYGTLLAEEQSTGPYSTPDSKYGRAWQEAWDKADSVERKFLEYRDPDGFFYLQFYQDCTESQDLRWGYYPPQRFKLLLYFPERDVFLASEEIYERYAFESFYVSSVSGGPAAAEALTATRQYSFGRYLAGAGVRFLLTLLIELGLALAFGYRSKRQLFFLLAVNFCTQLALNLALALAVYRYGSWSGMALYVLLELLIFLVEAILYARLLDGRPARGNRGKSRPVLYAFLANAASFAAGLALSRFWPDFF